MFFIKKNNVSSHLLTKLKHKSIKNRMNGRKNEGVSKGNVCERMQRIMKAGCKSKYCEKSLSRHCSHFSEQVLKEIFDSFWQMSWDQKKFM